MKETPDMLRVRRAMRAGDLTRDGFLGNDPRPPADIIEADAATVRGLGLTHAALVARMRELTRSGERGLGEEIEVGGRFAVRVDSVRGRLPCPFGHPGLYAKTNVTVRNLATHEELTFTELGLHLIEAHGFYEGLGSPYRLEPADLVRILEVRAE